MNILVTGSNGFIAKNLIQYFSEYPQIKILTFNKDSTLIDLEESILHADWIIHLAGVNRPLMESEFIVGNISITQKIADILQKNKKLTPIIFSSSIQVEYDNLYGQSKLAGEHVLLDLMQKQGNPIYICRLANVFGKWSRPNYNSAVATFCYNIANDLPVSIHNENSIIRLIYIDDVIETFWNIIQNHTEVKSIFTIEPEYQIKVGDLVKTIENFKNSRYTLVTEEVGTGLIRALYSTYLSFLNVNQFDYNIPKYEDERGIFVEMLKTKDSGQFSYFTAHPAVTRGGHYHHSKTEKFLVIKGTALFKFKHIISQEYYQLKVSGENPQIVETIPGWTHDITNIGDNELIVMLWANEIFDREKPDTYAMPLN